MVWLPTLRDGQNVLLRRIRVAMFVNAVSFIPVLIPIRPRRSTLEQVACGADDGCAVDAEQSVQIVEVADLAEIVDAEARLMHAVDTREE